MTLHYIELDLDGGPPHSFYVVAPDLSHSGRMAITEDAVPTAKLQWCKPFETNHTLTALPEKSFPLLACYRQLFTCQFKFTCKWKCFLPVYHMNQRPILRPPVNTPLHWIGPGWCSSTFTSCCCAGSNHQKWQAITGDAVTTAKLPWCKPLETMHTSTHLLGSHSPYLLAYYGQLSTCQFKFTWKCRFWFCFLPVVH